MITVENHIGKITVSERYLTDLVQNTVTGCFGVTDMNTVSVINDICSVLKIDRICGNGVSIKARNNRLYISLHVSVILGTNISAVAGSLKHRVKYAVEEATGIDVAGINVYVDAITE